LEKGTTEINGGLNLSLSAAKLEPEYGGKMDIDTKTLEAGALYYVVDNFGLGLTWDYTSTDIEISGVKAETSTSQFGPAASYNVSLNEDISLRVMGAFLMASMDYGSTYIV